MSEHECKQCDHLRELYQKALVELEQNKEALKYALSKLELQVTHTKAIALGDATMPERHYHRPGDQFTDEPEDKTWLSGGLDVGCMKDLKKEK